MINPRIDEQAKGIRESLGCVSAPVDVFAIAEKEGILLEPGDYGPDFHGRIEFMRRQRVFVLYYPGSFSGSSRARTRYSIGHELGHFYLPGHRRYLVRGGSYDCTVGFVSADEREREADVFAAYLLIPSDVLNLHANSSGFMTLSAIVGMADGLQVSVAAAAIRYVHYAEEKCGIVVSEKGKVKYYIGSDVMRETGLGWMERGVDIPRNSKAVSLLRDGLFRRVEGMETDTRGWFPKRRVSLPLWEESFALGYLDQVITLLAVWAN